MGVIILHQLEAKPRTVLRGRRCIEEKCSAFIGATGDELCQFGIGLINEKGQASLWGLICPQQLITAWRGMHILDKAVNIQHGTICHAYYAGEDKDDDSNVKQAITDLAEQIPNFEALRKDILAMTIDDDTLNAMLKICNSADNHIELCISELKEAVEAKIIRQTEEVSRTYQIAINKQLEIERDRKISQQPLSESKSFRQFCKKCGITNLFDNPYYDWPNYWTMDKIDENLVFNGLRYNGSAEVWCAEKPQSSSSTGHIGQPVLQLKDQREVILLDVRFKDNDMWGKIGSVKSEEEGEWFTLFALSGLEPHFVGLTFNDNDNPTPNDIARGYFIAHTKNPIKQVINAIMSS